MRTTMTMTMTTTTRVWSVVAQCHKCCRFHRRNCPGHCWTHCPTSRRLHPNQNTSVAAVVVGGGSGCCHHPQKKRVQMLRALGCKGKRKTAANAKLGPVQADRTRVRHWAQVKTRHPRVFRRPLDRYWSTKLTPRECAVAAASPARAHGTRPLPWKTSGEKRTETGRNNRVTLACFRERVCLWGVYFGM